MPGQYSLPFAQTWSTHHEPHCLPRQEIIPIYSSQTLRTGPGASLCATQFGMMPLSGKLMEIQYRAVLCNFGLVKHQWIRREPQPHPCAMTQLRNEQTGAPHFLRRQCHGPIQQRDKCNELHRPFRLPAKFMTQGCPVLVLAWLPDTAT